MHSNCFLLYLQYLDKPNFTNWFYLFWKYYYPEVARQHFLPLVNYARQLVQLCTVNTFLEYLY